MTGMELSWRHAARWLVLSLATASPVRADVLHLESGGRIEGRIVSRNDSSVVIEMGAGTMELPVSSIRAIEEGPTVLDEYDERLAGLVEDDLEGWLALGRWATANDLDNQARSAYRHVLSRDPANAPANTALGKVQFDGRWMSPSDAYRAQGYVEFEGEWLLPAEVQAIESERAAVATVERARDEAREAEARARAAEARARQAEADAAAREEAADEVDFIYWNSRPYRPPQRPIRPPRPQPRLPVMEPGEE